MPFNGIVLNRARLLRIERWQVSGFPTKGILSLSSGRLVVEDTVVRGSLVGVSLDAGTRAVLDQGRVEGNQFGLVSGLGAQATVRDCTATGNGVGLLASTPLDGLLSELSVESCLVTHNGTGIESRAEAAGDAVVRLSASTVTNNSVGLSQSGSAVIESRGTSTVRGNGTNVVGLVTPVPGE